MDREEQQKQMRAFLHEQLANSGSPASVNVHRQDIETWGGQNGLTPDEAIGLFESLEHTVWDGAKHNEEDGYGDLWRWVEITDVR